MSFVRKVVYRALLQQMAAPRDLAEDFIGKAFGKGGRVGQVRLFEQQDSLTPRYSFRVGARPKVRAI